LDFQQKETYCVINGGDLHFCFAVYFTFLDAFFGNCLSLLSYYILRGTPLIEGLLGQNNHPKPWALAWNLFGGGRPYRPNKKRGGQRKKIWATKTTPKNHGSDTPKNLPQLKKGPTKKWEQKAHHQKKKKPFEEGGNIKNNCGGEPGALTGGLEPQGGTGG